MGGIFCYSNVGDICFLGCGGCEELDFVGDQDQDEDEDADVDED